MRSTSPEFTGYNEPSDLQVDPTGKFIFVINRGEDSLVSFSLGADLVPRFQQSVSLAPSVHPGLAARSLAIEQGAGAQRIFVTDRPAGAIVTFSFEPATGHLKRAGECPVAEPGFVLLTSDR